MTLERAHQNFVIASSAPGAESASVQPRASIGTTNLPSTRILVVDDHVDSAEALARLLRRRGNRIEVAHDGAAALAVASAFRPAVVLFEIDLPQIDGCELATRLRDDPAHRRCLLIALTACDQEEIEKRCADAGLDHWLHKPVDVESLDSVIAEFLKKDDTGGASDLAERHVFSGGNQT